MAVAVRSTSNGPTGSGTNSTFTAPSGIQDGDILLAVFRTGSTAAPAVTPPAGFTQLTGFPVSVSDASPFVSELHAYWKLASGESGDYTFSHSAAFRGGMLYCISGAASSPFSPNPSVNSGTGTSSTALGVTTTVDNSLVVFALQQWDAGALSPPGGNTPTFTERYDIGNVVYLADGVLATAGATGNKTISNANLSSNVQWNAALIALKPPAGGSGSLFRSAVFVSRIVYAGGPS